MGPGAIKGGRIPARAIVLTGRFFSLFSPRMTGPDHRSPLLSGAFLVEGKYCSSSLDGYDCSRSLRERLQGVRFLIYSARPIAPLARGIKNMVIPHWFLR